MQQKIKNYIYKGVRTNSKNTIVYGYLHPSKDINRAILIDIGEITTNYNEVYLDSLELIYEDDNFGIPINTYKLINP
jgi:predicted RNA methylase